MKNPIGSWPVLYALAWIAYAALVAIVMGTMPVPALEIATFALGNSLPPALLGILVIRYYRRERTLTPFAAATRNIVFGFLFAVGSVAIEMPFLRLIFGAKFRFRLENAIWGMLIASLLFIILASGAHIQRVHAHLVRERQRAAEAEALRAKAELAALRARIDPHFLFNTLHSLLALVRQDPARAEEAIEQFADILRYTFAAGVGGEERTLAQEWELVDNYLALERLRLGARLRVREQLDRDAAATPLPVLTLQPLVENAVRYAVAPRAAGGCIDIEAKRTERGVRIDVSDDGPGADPAQLSAGDGHGLQLVRQRLEQMYRGAATMELAKSDAGGLRVTIEVPRA